MKKSAVVLAATLLIGGSLFAGNVLRVGAIKELVFRNCISDHACIGHNLKSRAYKTTVVDCVFDGGHDGRSSYLLNCRRLRRLAVPCERDDGRA